ncbi:hypothetical protein [Neobacillus jeddahensis]|nr:hypothetical protein [Neobacillus jeddahensis]
MEYINPLFNEQKKFKDNKVEKKYPENKIIKPMKPRAARSDKCKNIN